MAQHPILACLPSRPGPIEDSVTGQPDDPQVAVLFSGGLDSSILVAELLARGHRVWPLFVDCGWFWQAEELKHARRFLQAVRAPRLEDLAVLRMPLADLYGDHWSITGRRVPAADEPDEKVYLPGHNPLLLVKAQVWCHLRAIGRLALGALASNPFGDATDDFFRDFEAAMDRALSGHVQLVRPLAAMDKRQVMQLGRNLPLELTFSCLAPVEGLHCGACNKCAERRRAFAVAEIADPTRYAAPLKIAV
jgi:7-cyano-7-deazaguanine synthase